MGIKEIFCYYRHGKIHVQNPEQNFCLQEGDRYTIKLERISRRKKIDTEDYGGFNKAHKKFLREKNRRVRGVWSFSQAARIPEIDFDIGDAYRV